MRTGMQLKGLVALFLLGLVLFTANPFTPRCFSASSTTTTLGRERLSSFNSMQWPGCERASLHIPQFALRAKLMVLVTETSDRRGRSESAHIADNLSRYCARHGYLFKLHHFVVDDSLGIYGTRWKELLKYWDMADWLLHVDSDTIVANFNNSMDNFLDGPHHVMLNYRGNKEITAAAVGVRTTDFGRCFMQRWLGLIAAQRASGKERNSDNGALLLLLAEFLDPQTAKDCNSRFSAGHKQYWEFMACWEKVYEKFAQVAMNTDQPVKMYPPLGGFWREQSPVRNTTHKGRPCYDETWTNHIMYRRCWSTDIFISGWKTIGANMWPRLGLNTSVANCPFNHIDQELEFARKCCLVEYPGCFAADGTNTCRQSPACADPQAGEHMRHRAQIGFGICQLAGPDPTFKLSPLLPAC